MFVRFLRTLVSRALAALGSVAFVYVVAREFGAGVVGALAVGQAIVMGLAVLARLGKNQVMMRLAGQQGEAPLVARYYWKATYQVLVTACILSLVTFLLFKCLPPSLLIQDILPGLLFGTPPFAATYIAVGYLKGLGRAEVAVLLESGGVYLLSAGAFFVVILLGIETQGAGVGWAFGISAWLAFAVALSSVPAPFVRPGSGPMPESKGEVSFFFISLAEFVQTHAYLYAAALFLSAGDVGLLRTAERVALLIGFALVVINAIYPRHFAKLFYEKRLAELKDKYFESAVHGTLAGLPLFIVVFIFAPEILASFGPEFPQAALALRLLAIGQLCNAATGSVALLLNMSGRERLVRNINVGMCLVTLTAFCVGIANGGFVVGAAILAGATIGQNILLVLYVTQFFREYRWAETATGRRESILSRGSK